MPTLFHETSLERARNIIRTKLICGLLTDGQSHENHPHFSLNRDRLNRNYLPDGGQILLTFESDMPVQRQVDLHPQQGFTPGYILEMYGLDGASWQAIVAPTSPPLTLIGYEVQHGQLTNRDKNYFNKARKKRVKINAGFLRHWRACYSERRLFMPRIKLLVLGVLNIP